jgi:type I restriction enzyme M protein
VPPQPLQSDEFEPCLEWWKHREENDRAWKMSAKDVVKYGEDGALQSVNLDAKNPRGKADVTHLPPDQLAESILAKEQRIAEIVTKIKGMLGGPP